MRKLCNYLRQQERLTAFVGILLGIVFVTNVELSNHDVISKIYAQSNEGEVESVVSEVIDLDEQEIESEENEEEVIVPNVSNTLIEEESIDHSIETQTNSVSGGISIETKPIIDDTVVEEESSPAEAQLGTGVGHGGFAAHQVGFGQQAGILFPGEEIRPHRDGGEEGEDTQQDSGDDPVFGPPLLVEFSPIGGGTFQFHFFLPFFL